MASAASAHVKHAPTAPTVNFFASPLPMVGTTLSNSTNTPSIHWRDGWRMSSSNGIASASVDFFRASSTNTNQIWSYSGGADSVAGRYQWSQRIGDYTELDGSATDELGTTGSNFTATYPELSHSGAASYSSGWQTSRCSCLHRWPDPVFHQGGATATFQITYRRLVSFVSDTGPGQGEVALKVNGQTVKDVNLSGGSKVNRVIVWNSGYLNDNDSYTLTVKVVRGRVDIQGFITP